jgi:tetratricopeptide (TPR) repeat protein
LKHPIATAETGPTSQRASFARHSLLLLTLCFAVYGNSLSGNFVWDDTLQIVKNVGIRRVAEVPRAFSTGVWSFLGRNVTNDYYRPLQTVVYIVAYRIGRLSTFVYHLTNVILHSAVTILMYFLCIQLGWKLRYALMGAAVFATHPAHTEAVAWIAGIADLLCALFYLAALSIFLHHQNSRPGTLHKTIWFSAACFLAAMLSKEMAVTFPLVAALIWFTTGIPLRPKLKDATLVLMPYLSALGIYGVLRVAAIGWTLPAVGEGQTRLLDRLSLVVWAVGEYFRYSFVPYPLYVHHVVPSEFKYRVISTLVSGGIILAVFLLVWFSRRRISGAMLWLTIFGITLLPVLYFRGLGSGFFAERYLYLPSVAIIITAFLFLKQLGVKRAAVVTSCLIAVFSIATVQRNRDWHDEERLFRSSLEIQPDAAPLWNKLGFVYLDRHDNSAAEQCFKEALRCSAHPRFEKERSLDYHTQVGLGIAVGRQHRTSAAIEHLRKALTIIPEGSDANAALGAILINQNDYPAGMALLEKAIKVNPVDELARDYMGAALFNQHRYKEAAAYFREAITLNPQYAPAKKHLSMTLEALQRDSAHMRKPDGTETRP